MGKSLPSSSSRAPLTPAIAPPWLATSVKSAVKPAKAPVTLLPTTKAKPKPQALPWREQPEFAELLQKQQTETNQEDRIKARREIRKRLNLLKPKGTAGLSLVRSAPSLCSSCVVRREKLAPKVREYANKWIRKEREKAASRRKLEGVEAKTLTLRSRSRPPRRLRLQSRARDERSPTHSSERTTIKAVSISRSRSPRLTDDVMPEAGTIIQETPCDEKPDWERSSSSPSKNKKKRSKPLVQHWALLDPMWNRDSEEWKAHKKKVSTRKEDWSNLEGPSVSCSDEEGQFSPVARQTSRSPAPSPDRRPSHLHPEQWPELPRSKTPKRKKAKLVKENLRKDRSKTFREALIQDAPEQDTPSAAPVPSSYRICTLDIHGVLDSGENGSFPEDAYSAMLALHEHRKIKFVALSYIGLRSANLRKKAAIFCKDIEREFKRRYGFSPISGTPIITNARTGASGKVTAAKELGSKFHVDDNVDVCNEFARARLDPCLQLRGSRRPKTVFATVPSATTLVGCLYRLFGEFDKAEQ